MLRAVAMALSVAVPLAWAGGCIRLEREALTVRAGKRVTYECEGGERIVASYYALSDGSLDFVKVTLPDGKDYTLPCVVSASGARYTDDRELVWWTKGDTAFAQTRDAQGQWQVKYGNCRAIREGR